MGNKSQKIEKEQTVKDLIKEKINDEKIKPPKNNSNNPRVFLEISINDEIIGIIKIELFESIVPKTCEVNTSNDNLEF
jgi:hypothetical protein